jgi:hypothetical protein
MALRMAILSDRPQPQTATVSPGWMSHLMAACEPVGRMSLRNGSFSSRS